MARFALLALLLVAAPLAACGSEHTTVIAQPGSTVVAPGNAKVVNGH
jgi:hypothetical protein